MENAQKVKCKLCSKLFAYCGGTTNLREHLISKHPDLYTLAKKRKGQKTLDVFSRKVCPEPRAMEIHVTNLIANMIAVDMKPVNIIEGKGCGNLMLFLEPGYKIPSRKHFAKVIQKKHEDCKTSLNKKLSEDAKKIALTTDIWSSRANEPYIPVTVHYISPCWSLHSYMLATLY